MAEMIDFCKEYRQASNEAFHARMRVIELEHQLRMTQSDLDMVQFYLHDLGEPRVTSAEAHLKQAVIRMQQALCSHEETIDVGDDDHTDVYCIRCGKRAK